MVRNLLPIKAKKRVRDAVSGRDKKLFGKKEPKISRPRRKTGTVNANEKLNQKLLIACSTGTKQEIIELIKQGADVNARNKKGETPLLLVALRKDPGEGKHWIFGINELMGLNTGINDNPLEDREEIVRLLIKNGAEIRLRSNSKDHIRMVETGRLEEILRRAGAV